MAEPGDLPAGFELGGRPVGEGRPAYVIAEAGANHNRDLGIARELVDVAAEAGADAVKFQTYSGELLYSTKAPRFEHSAALGDRSPSELLEQVALPREWQAELRDHAGARGIAFFSTPFDAAAVAELAALEVPAMKIASFEIVDPELIAAAAGSGRPLLISTGMATLAEVEEALGWAAAAGAAAVGLMQCTSLYPAPPERANLRAMATMRSAFGVPVGLSDHTTGTATPIAAAALGAAFVEKHFTLDREMEGPDHAFALEPRELGAMVAGIREAEAALGDGRKRGPGPEEAEENHSLARRSLIVVGDHPAGTVLSAEMLTAKRPGFGVAPKDREKVLGRTLRVAVEHDDVLTWEML
jgi:N,N'-diacetyllegionaminate synthase